MHWDGTLTQRGSNPLVGGSSGVERKTVDVETSSPCLLKGASSPCFLKDASSPCFLKGASSPCFLKGVSLCSSEVAVPGRMVRSCQRTIPGASAFSWSEKRPFQGGLYPAGTRMPPMTRSPITGMIHLTNQSQREGESEETSTTQVVSSDWTLANFSGLVTGLSQIFPV